MGNSESEADARIVIDDLLRKAGWDPTDKSQVRTEVTARRLPSQIKEGVVTSDDEILRTDYALLSSRGRNLSVVEAKRKAIDPYTAKNQARPAAEALDADFIFLSNGELIYFWDYRNEDARLVHSFFSQRDLERLSQRHRDQKALATIPVPETYLRYGEVPAHLSVILMRGNGWRSGCKQSITIRPAPSPTATPLNIWTGARATRKKPARLLGATRRFLN